MSLKAWKVLQSDCSFDKRYLRVLSEKVELENGVIIDDYQVVESPSWAATVAITAKQELVLVEQYRHGHQALSLELPAGIVDSDEEPLQAGLRELLEESGYASTEAQLFWKVRPEPARHRQWAYFVFAKNAQLKQAPTPESTEALKVVLWPLSDLDAALERMVHAPHVAAILLAARKALLLA